MGKWEARVNFIVSAHSGMNIGCIMGWGRMGLKCGRNVLGLEQ